MPSTLQASVFIGKNYSDNWHSIKKKKISQWNKCSTICEIGVRTRWDLWSENNWLGKLFMEVFVFGDERVISLQRTKVYVFSDSVLCLGKIQNSQSDTAWEHRLEWFKSTPEYKASDTIDGEPMEFEWNVFPGFTTLQLCSRVQESLTRLSVEPEKKIPGRIILMSLFNDISWGSKDKKNAIQVLNAFLSMRRDLEQDNGYSSDLDQKRSGTLLVKTVHKENGTELQKHTPSLPIHESTVQKSD